MKQNITMLTFILMLSNFSFSQTKADLHLNQNKFLINYLNPIKRTVDIEFNLDKFNPLNTNDTNDYFRQMTATQKIDSVIKKQYDAYYNNFHDYGKIYYTYSNEGDIANMTTLIFEYGTWKNDSKLVSTYNSNNLLESETGYYWYGNTWQFSNKTEYVYDTNENILEEIFYNYNQNSISYKKLYEYNANEQIILFQQINLSDSLDSYEKVYAYDANNNLQLEKSTAYNFVNGNYEWMDLFETEYVYDSNNNNITLLNKENVETLVYDNYTWSTVYEWLETNKQERLFDANNNILQDIGYNKSQGIWNAYLKIERMYDFNNNLISYQKFNAQLNNGVLDWIFNRGIDYEYLNDNLINAQYANNGNINNLEYIYDEQADASTILNTEPFFYHTNLENHNYVNKPLEILNSYATAGSNDFTPSEKIVFYYSDINPTSIKELPTEKIVGIYPNKFTDVINFEFKTPSNNATLEIVDMQGKTQVFKDISNLNKINLQHLNNGNYVYIINVDGNKQTGKLVKE